MGSNYIAIVLDQSNIAGPLLLGPGTNTPAASQAAPAPLCSCFRSPQESRPRRLHLRRGSVDIVKSPVPVLRKDRAQESHTSQPPPAPASLSVDESIGFLGDPKSQIAKHHPETTCLGLEYMPIRPGVVDWGVN